MSGLREPAALTPEALLATLRHRPFLPIAATMAVGCGLGAATTLTSAGFRSSSGILPIVGFVLLFWCLGLVLKWNVLVRKPVLVVICLLPMVLLSGFYANQRTLPPPNDISRLVRGISVPDGPQWRTIVYVEGWVADAPRRSDFGMTFPLTAIRTRVEGGLPQNDSGNIRVEAPRDIQVRQGDAVVARLELADLPRWGNPGERTRRTLFIRDDCWSRARLQGSADLKVLRSVSPTAFTSGLQTLRNGIVERYAVLLSSSSWTRVYPHATAELLSAMVFGAGGTAEPLPYQTRETFRRAGLLHILVASGSQVALLAGFLILSFRFFRQRGVGLLLFLLPLLVAYAMLTGGDASIWRATVIGGCAGLALLLGRDTDGLSLWCAAFVALLLIDPLSIHDIGFQLSFAAAWGLIVLSPVLQRHTSRRLGESPLLTLLVLSLSAQAATLPLIYYHFGNMNFAGLFSNMIAVPAAGILLFFGPLGLVVPWVNPLNALLVRGIEKTAVFAAALPGAQLDSLPGPLSFAVVWYAGLLLLLFAQIDLTTHRANLRTLIGEEWRKLRANNFYIGNPRHWVVFAGLVLIILAAMWLLRSSEGPIRVTVLDVGQGESIVLEGPDGTVLIDGGTSFDEGRGDVGRGVIVPYLQSRGIGRLKAIILTHPDADHCSGLLEVVREIPVTVLIDGGASALQNASPAQRAAAVDYQRLIRECKKRGIQIEQPEPNRQISLGDGAKITELGPRVPLLESENDNGAVVRLEHGQVSMLFTADIEAAGENRLLSDGTNVRCTVLKLAHHGSSSSSSESFLRAASPKFSVLSCGRYNSYGHPSAQVLGRLATRGIDNYRTDRDGAVTFLSDGIEVEVQTAR